MKRTDYLPTIEMAIQNLPHRYGKVVESQHWEGKGDYPDGIDQPLDPGLFGFGILYAEDHGDELWVVVRTERRWDDTTDSFKTEVVQGYDHKEYGHIFRDVYRTSVYFPSGMGHSETSVNITGGGVSDPQRVLLAARCLELAATIALFVDDAIKQGTKPVPDPEPPVITPDRFLTLATDKWVVAEMKPKNGRKRTIRGDLKEVNDYPPAVYERGDRSLDKVTSVTIRDKAGRYQTVDIPLVDRLITGGENGITLVENGELALDYRLARR